MAAYWIIVEAYENWKTDERLNFSMFGISERYKNTASRVAKGDYLFCYISSRISAFSGIHNATADGLKRLRYGGEYLTSFPYYLSTEPLITLPDDKWLPIKPMLSNLELTKDKSGWAQLFRSTIRQLSEEDGKFLSTEISRSLSKYL